MHPHDGNRHEQEEEEEDMALVVEEMLTFATGLQNRAMPPPFGGLSPFGFPRAQPDPFGAFGGRDPHAPPQSGNLQE